MASLQKHQVGGRTYWRIVESRRVKGKPRPVPVLYLGTADALLKRLTESPASSTTVRSYQHGDVAVLKVMLDRLGVIQTIDRHVSHSSRGLSVGTTLAMAVLNRAAAPRSKRAWASWAAETSVPHLFGLSRPERLTSQYFWDQMNLVSEEALEAIERDLSRKIVQEFQIKLDTLLYDATNFFTYIASDNSRPQLPQRGHSKQKRVDLRIFSLAMVVSRDGQIPLCTHVYEGNRVDVKEFPVFLDRMTKRVEEVVGEKVTDLTVVYDKGNLSKMNQAKVDGGPIHYVTSLPLSQQRELADIPKKSYQVLGTSSPLAGISVYRGKRTIWGQERTVVLLFSPTLAEGQKRGLQQHLAKRLKCLAEWKEQLAKPGSGPRTSATGRQKAKALAAGQYLKDVLTVEYNPRKRGANRLNWSVSESGLSCLEAEVFGKMLLITDRDDWSTEEIIAGYRGQSHIERVFRQHKDPDHLTVRPQFHWTDQKIRVHTFICTLAYTLSRLVERDASRLAGWSGSLSNLLNDLGKVRLALVVRNDKSRPKCDWVLEKRSEGDMPLKVFQALVPHEPPFVYTHAFDT